MAGTNTEKPTGKEEKMKQQAVQTTGKPTKQSQKEIQKQNQPKAPQEKKQENKEEKTEEQNKTQETKTEQAKKPAQEKKESSEESGEKKSKKQTDKKPKKSEAKVNVRDLPLSTKVSAALCKFIKNKEIKKAVEELNQVIEKKKPVPMKGEYPHQKGIMSGKYPVKAAKEFRTMVRSLGANAAENGLEKPIIRTAIANIGQRPMAKFGMWQRKRTHLTLIAKDSAGQENKGKNTNKNKAKKKNNK